MSRFGVGGCPSRGSVPLGGGVCRNGSKICWRSGSIGRRDCHTSGHRSLDAVVDRDDKHHASCVRLLEELEGPLLLPSTILIEAGWTINRHMGPRVHARFLDLVVEEFELVDLQS